MNISLLIEKYKTFAACHKKPFFVVRLAFSMVLLVFVLRKINIAEIPSLFGEVNPALALVALLVTFLISLLFVLRIYLLFGHIEKLSFFEHYLVNRAGNFFNFFMIGNLGQEISRIRYYKTSKKNTIFVSLLDRLLGALSLLAILLFFGRRLWETLGVSFFLGMCILVAVILVFIYLVGYFSKKTGIKTGRVNISFFISIFYSFGLVLIAFLSFKAVGVQNIFLDLIWVIPSLSILLMLPISINGIGVKEFFLIYTLSIDPHLVIMYSLLDYTIFIVLSLPGLFYFLLKAKELKYQTD